MFSLVILQLFVVSAIYYASIAFKLLFKIHISLIYEKVYITNCQIDISQWSAFDIQIIDYLSLLLNRQRLTANTHTYLLSFI